jgi:large subunit ribosomal protein L21
MYAVVATGGKQYKVAPGDTILIEKIDGEVGAEVEFNDVLVVVKDGGDLITGAGQARVKGTITAQDRGSKVIVFKFKRKKQMKRTNGHRQYLTSVKVTEVLA